MWLVQYVLHATKVTYATKKVHLLTGGKIRCLNIMDVAYLATTLCQKC